MSSIALIMYPPKGVGHILYSVGAVCPSVRVYLHPYVPLPILACSTLPVQSINFILGRDKCHIKWMYLLGVRPFD